MKENEKLINAIIDLSQEIKGMRSDMNMQLNGLNNRVDKLNKRVENLEKQQIKTNLALGEMRLSYMRLDGKVSKLDGKISKLDEKVSKLDESVNGLRSDFNKYARRNDERANIHEKRIIRLEDNTFGKDAQRISMAKEPNAEYKKKKMKLKK